MDIGCGCAQPHVSVPSGQTARRAVDSPRSRKAAYAWDACLVAFGMLIFWGATRAVTCRNDSVPAGHAFAAVSSPAVQVRGPWGVLDETTVMLDPPPEFYLPYSRTQQIWWVFPGASVSGLRGLIESLALPAAGQAALLDESRWRREDGRVIVRPPIEVVHDLAADARARLYAELAKTPDNAAQCYPCVFREPFEQRFAGCRVPPQVLEDVRRMTYRIGELTLFADLAYFQITLPAAQAAELARFAARVPVVVARLDLAGAADLDRLDRYWLLPVRHDDLEPVYHALAHAHAADGFDISGFLPLLPQFLAYTFPAAEPEVPGNANCVWTSMNFFRKQPDARFLEPQFTQRALSAEYRRVASADAFGDMIMLYHRQPDGGMKLVHMCIHIADDLVFTKNGAHPGQPWLLMRLPDVMALFAPEMPLELAVFRRKASRL